MGIKHSYQSATANNAGSEVSSTNWNADHNVDGPVPIALTAAATAITAPASTNVTLFARSYGGRGMFGAQETNGTGYIFMPQLKGHSMYWSPQNGGSTATVIGSAAITATGTGGSVNLATTNRYTRMKKMSYSVTVAATTAVAGFRASNGIVTVGAASAGDGGFYYVLRWGPDTGVATTTNRAFAGLQTSTSAPTDVEPSTIANIIGMGWDAADTNVQFMNRSATTLTKTDLGASFPVPTVDATTAYEIVMFSPPGTTQSVSYQITNLTTGAVATGKVTTNLPTNTTLLLPSCWMSVGGTSSVIGVSLIGMYLEQGGP